MTTMKSAVVKKLVALYPKASTKTLARIAYKENPALFMSLETARSAFRYYLGTNGSENRAAASDKSIFRKPGVSGDPFGKLPKPRQCFAGGWSAVSFSGPLRALILSDIHIPYFDETALKSALKYGVDNQADFVLLNGDIADCFSVSKWENDPRERDFAAEVESVKQFLSVLRETFPKAKIVYKLGNHEERYIRYMSLKAPELLGVPDFELRSIYKLDDFDVQLIDGMRPIQLGKLNVLHGHEYRFNISNPVNPARGFFLRAKVHCLGGHLHQSSQHSEKNLEGKVVSTWSTGCLCDLHPDYRPLNPWNHGFAFVEVESDGIFDVRNLKIIDGKIY
jgi:predicted phosphodiesterase